MFHGFQPAHLVAGTVGIFGSNTAQLGALEIQMVMPGLPNWLFYAGVGAVLVVSFVVAEIVGPGVTGGAPITSASTNTHPSSGSRNGAWGSSTTRGCSCWVITAR